MAPEQVRGQTADDRADLFALGAILYELLTSKRAFHKPTSAETMSAILNEEPPSVSQITPGIPPALQKVVQRCMKKLPNSAFIRRPTWLLHWKHCQSRAALRPEPSPRPRLEEKGFGWLRRDFFLRSQVLPFG
jgi:serine/threonine protein kinase